MQKLQKKLSITKAPDDKQIVIYPSQGKTHSTLFWLHRAGECSETYDEIFFHGDVPSQHGIKIRILQAPVRTITFKQHRSECAWFDIDAIYDEDILTKKQQEIFNFGHIEQSVILINKYIKEEVEQMTNNGVTNPYSRIYIGGVGQGATMALHYAFTSKQALAGIIAVGGYLLKSSPIHHLNICKILLLNGLKDQAIPQKVSKNSYDRIIGHFNSKYQILSKQGDQFTQAYVKQISKFINNSAHHH